MMIYGPRKSSIRQQLTNVVVLASFVALAIACAAFQLYERESFRRALTEEATTLADTLGANSAASLTFEDQKTAKEILGGLRVEGHITQARLYSNDGKVFAEYRSAGAGKSEPIAFREGEEAEFNSDSLILRRPILLNGEKAGAIAIVYELSALRKKMAQYTGISAIVLLVSILATLLVAGRLLRPITAPILELAAVAGRVTAEEDYTLRAVAQRDDEVGKLVASFNQMLKGIQERDMALQVAKDELEVRVEARTAELQISLKELEDLKFALDQHCIVARTDRRGVITYANERFCSVSKYSREELIGKTHAIVNSRHHPKEFFEDLWRTILSGRTWTGEVKNKAKDGSIYWVDTTIVPFCDADGRPFQFIAIRKEITDLKKIEEELRRAKDVAEQASRAKSEFLANMSHEIRTPLNGIMGMTDLALDTHLTPEQREFLETVKSSSESLLTVINDILDFSKIEAGKLDLESVDFNLRETVESTLKTLAVRADEKRLELACEIEGDVPEMVRGDAVRLRQVITNLTGNAIKFTDTGEVVVKVGVEKGMGSELMLHFTVSDTGVGILPSKLKMIFDPFSQADTSTTRKYGGTGLGLTISSRLVQMMGGRIWVESEVGHGSQFHFTVQMGVGTTKKPEGYGRGVQESLKGLRVLLVDDNRTNRRILEATLRSWGMEPTTAAGGEQALAEVNAAQEAGKPYQLILTDMHMPGMDGFEMVEHLRQSSEMRPVTVVMLTSAGRHGDLKRCQELSVSAYLLKPIRQAELRETIARVMGVSAEKEKSGPTEQPLLKGARDSREALKLLVAEDNLVNQRLITRLLEKRGHRVALANNGREAAEKAERESFDLVFMDVQMPEMDGFEATGVIRSREKAGGARLPIIALTAHAMKGDREKCLAHGMDDYLTKPIQPAELDTILERWAARAQVKA